MVDTCGAARRECTSTRASRQRHALRTACARAFVISTQVLGGMRKHKLHTSWTRAAPRSCRSTSCRSFAEVASSVDVDASLQTSENERGSRSCARSAWRGRHVAGGFVGASRSAASYDTPRAPEPRAASDDVTSGGFLANDGRGKRAPTAPPQEPQEHTMTTAFRRESRTHAPHVLAHIY